MNLNKLNRIVENIVKQIENKREHFVLEESEKEDDGLKFGQLTPSKILNLKKLNTYTKFNDLKNDIIESNVIQQIKENDNNLYNFIEHLIDLVENGEVNGMSFSNIDDFLLNTEQHEYDTPLDNFENISINNINKLTSNFGELLTPLLFLRLFTDCQIEFPISSSEKLIDFNINLCGVSVKKLGGGNRASGKSILDLYNKEIKKLEEKPQTITDDTTDLNKEEKNDIFSESELEFINNVLTTYDLNAFEQQKRLVYEFLLKDTKNSFKKEFEKTMGFSVDDFNENVSKKKKESVINIINKIDDKLKNVSVSDYFKSYYNLIEYDPKDLNEYVNDIEKNWDSLNVEHKWGKLIRPMYSLCVKNINDIYIDEITSVIQKVTNFKQVYIDLDTKLKKIIFKVISSKNSEWRMSITGFTTNKPGKKLGIEAYNKKQK